MEAPFPSQAWFMYHVNQHQASLRASIRALGVRSDAVDDIAQDAFVVAWQKLSDFDPNTNFGAWVAEIARRLVANERRKEARQSRILAGKLTDLLLQQESDPPTGLGSMEQAEYLTCLRICLDNLPDSDREIIRLRYFEGLLPGAIASRLGLASNALRQKLLRVRRTLLRCVEQRMLGGEKLD